MLPQGVQWKGVMACRFIKFESFSSEAAFCRMHANPNGLSNSSASQTFGKRERVDSLCACRLSGLRSSRPYRNMKRETCALNP